MSGEQRLKAAHERARDQQASMQRDADARRQGGGVSAGTGNSVRVKEEPVSDAEDDAMDTSSSSGVPNGSVNGHPGGSTTSPSQELKDWVYSTFRKHLVLTLSELKRLFNLHLASLPPGDSLFHSISDRLLQDAVLLSHCKQILVPVRSLIG